MLGIWSSHKHNVSSDLIDNEMIGSLLYWLSVYGLLTEILIKIVDWLWVNRLEDNVVPLPANRRSARRPKNQRFLYVASTASVIGVVVTARLVITGGNAKIL